MKSSSSDAFPVMCTSKPYHTNFLLSFVCLHTAHSLKQNLDIKTLNDLIALLASLSSHTDRLSPADREVLSNVAVQLAIADLSSSGQSAVENFVRQLRVSHWSACLQEDQAQFWTLGETIYYNFLFISNYKSKLSQTYLTLNMLPCCTRPALQEDMLCWKY